MTDELLSLADLAEKSGVELRTLRSWIQQGLVPGPDSRGRNARYAASALTRARAVRAMRDIYGMSIQAIRQELMIADKERLDSYSAMADGHSPESTQRRMEPPPGSTAADYLKALRATGVFGGHSERPNASKTLFSRGLTPSEDRQPAFHSDLRATPATTRLRTVIERLERAGGQRSVSRKTQGEVQFHISITPDIELTIRGDLAPDEITQFQEIADLLRNMLTGASEDE